LLIAQRVEIEYPCRRYSESPKGLNDPRDRLPTVGVQKEAILHTTAVFDEPTIHLIVESTIAVSLGNNNSSMEYALKSIGRAK
jgi:hypothetical protein